MLRRRPSIAFLLEDRPPGLLAVSGLGSCTWDLCAAGDDARNFCFVGAMGQAAPFALGLAMAQPERRVVLFTGDGELLMSLGVLATIATRAPRNLALVVLDNESYVETGGQPTATAGPTDLAAIARGAGIPDVRSVTASSALPELRAALREAKGPLFAVLKVAVEDLPLTLPHSLDGVTAINRFRDAVLSPAG